MVGSGQKTFFVHLPKNRNDKLRLWFTTPEGDEEKERGKKNEKITDLLTKIVTADNKLLSDKFGQVFFIVL